VAATDTAIDVPGGGGSAWGPPRWVSPSAVVLCVAGLGVSVYLTIAHYTASIALACPDTGTINCEKVTTSPQSVIVGIPVAVLGVVFFASLLILNVPAALRRPSRFLRLSRLGLATGGVGFAVYLIYTELFTVHAICLWCTAEHVLAFLLFGVTVFGQSLARPLGVSGRAST
jgi:uncharacterized membrane protein